MAAIVRWTGLRAGYDFVVFDLNTAKWNDVPGVYVFCKVVNDRWQPVYIGQCGSFLTRISQAHHKWRAVLLHGATHVHAMVERDERARLQIEADLLGRFNTPCNEALN